MKANVGGGGNDFELPKAGLTIGRCFKVVDLGTQESKYKDQVNYKRQILVSVELPSMRMEIDGQDLPMSVSKKYSLSFNKKATLRIDMEAWYGKKFNDKDIENSGGFDPAKILGRPGQVMIEHNESGGTTYANITAFMPLAEGQTCPDQENPSFIFDLDEFDRDKYDTFSEKMQAWISKSPEAKKALGDHSGAKAEAAPPIDDGFDDIPF